MITLERIEKNYELFMAKLQQVGVDTSKIDEEFASKLKLASFSMVKEKNEDTCCQGALLNTILRKLTPTALKLNEILSENVKVDTNSLIKVCLLHQISKAVMFIQNDNEWEIKNRNMYYKYAPNSVGLKMGIRSLLIATRLGITFTDEEAEAMTVLDKSEDDKQTKFYGSPLATILKQAAEITYLENRN